MKLSTVITEYVSSVLEHTRINVYGEWFYIPSKMIEPVITILSKYFGSTEARMIRLTYENQKMEVRLFKDTEVEIQTLSPDDSAQVALTFRTLQNIIKYEPEGDFFPTGYRTMVGKYIEKEIVVSDKVYWQE